MEGEFAEVDLPSHLQAASRSLLIELRAAEVIQTLRAHAIEPILLKGPVLTRWLYDGDASSRPMGDTDLLVAPAAVERSENLLFAMGYQHDPLDDITGDKPWHAHAWKHRESGIYIDLHRTLIGAEADPATVWQVLSSHTATFELRGVEVSCLRESGLALHVALHAAQGGPRDTKALEDLRRAVQLRESLWQEAKTLAAELDALDALAAGLRLHPKGDAIAHALGLPERVSVPVALRSTSAAPEAVGLAWLLATPGMIAKLKLVLRKTFPPAAFMDVWYSVERRGRWGACGAYAFRIKWLASRLPPAARAWWEARRLGR